LRPDSILHGLGGIFEHLNDGQAVGSLSSHRSRRIDGPLYTRWLRKRAYPGLVMSSFKIG
jgi:hypothetical protein